MAKAVITDAYKNWQLHCTEVQNATTVNRSESKQIQLERVSRARSDYDYFVSYYFPHFAKCKNGKFAVVVLVTVP